MSRTAKLLGRVLRNLKRHGVRENESLDEEIYGELTSGQDNIISSTHPDRIVTLTLKDGIEYYPLTTDSVTDPESASYKNNITSIKVVKQPQDFLYRFKVVSNIEFINILEGVFPGWDNLGYGDSVPDIMPYIKTGIELEGTKNGVNTEFTIPQSGGIVYGSEKIYLNGVPQNKNADYDIEGTTITFVGSIIPDSLDTLVADYIAVNPFMKSGVTLSGDRDGTNRTFTIPESSNIVRGSEQIFFNGILQVRNVDYEINDKVIVFLHSILPVQEDSLIANWIILTDAGAGQPRIGTVIGKRLRVYPVPGEIADGKEIELFVYQKTSQGIIDADNEPELDEEYDKALEYFATAQFLSGQERSQWINDFDKEKERLKPLTHRKRTPIERSPIPGWS